MPKYNVRVTRDFGSEHVDLTVEAEDWEAAKKQAVKDAEGGCRLYFDMYPVAEFYVASEDDEEEEAE